MNRRPANAIDVLQKARVLYYAGGFAHDADVETMARNLLVGLADDVPNRTIFACGTTPAKSTPLAEIAASGATVRSTLWRWGTRWNLPDRMLLRRAGDAIASADIVLFGRSFEAQTHQTLRSLAVQTGRHIPMVLITPTRPRELWGKAAPEGLLACFDAIIVQADRFEDDLRRLGYEGRVETIPNMPDPWRAPALTPIADPGFNEPIRIGYVGKLDPEKNVGALLDAFALLGRWHDENATPRSYELHIHGNGPELADLRARVNQTTALAGRVAFHAAVEGRAAIDAIDACHAILSASRAEGQAPHALEALRRGRPVIATAAGALPEILNDRELGMLVPHNDPDAMARAIVATTDALLAGTLSPMRIHDKWDRRFSQRTVREQYLDLVHLLIARSRGEAAVATRKPVMVIKPLVPRKRASAAKVSTPSTKPTAASAPNATNAAASKRATNKMPAAASGVATLAARFAAKKRLPPAFAVAPEKLARGATLASTHAALKKPSLPAMTPEAFRKAAPAALRAMLGQR